MRWPGRFDGFQNQSARSTRRTKSPRASARSAAEPSEPEMPPQLAGSFDYLTANMVARKLMLDYEATFGARAAGVVKEVVSALDATACFTSQLPAIPEEQPLSGKRRGEQEQRPVRHPHAADGAASLSRTRRQPSPSIDPEAKVLPEIASANCKVPKKNRRMPQSPTVGFGQSLGSCHRIPLLAE